MLSHRYFPRLPVPVMCDPISLAVRSAAPASCLRTARGWCTRTAVIVRPVTCAASPRRTVSTSGNSGTGSGLASGLFQGGPRRGRGLLLGFLLGPPHTRAVPGVHHDHRRGELLVVIRSRRRDHIGR